MMIKHISVYLSFSCHLSITTVFYIPTIHSFILLFFCSIYNFYVYHFRLLRKWIFPIQRKRENFLSKCKRSVRVAGKIENKEMNKKGDEAIRFFNFPSYWLTGLSLLKLPSYSHIFYFHTIVICVQEKGRRERDGRRKLWDFYLFWRISFWILSCAVWDCLTGCLSLCLSAW